MLIHINNSTAILGNVVSVSIRDAGGNLVAIRVTGGNLEGPVLIAAYGHSTVLDVTDVVRIIERLLDGKERSAGDVAHLLADESLKLAGIILAVEFRPQWSDHWAGTLLIASEEA